MKKYALLASCCLVFLFGGCLPEPAARNGKSSSSSHDDHDHGTGPHGGIIGEWGAGDYHFEFTVDHEKKEAIVFVLKEDAKTAAPIKAEKLLLTLKSPAVQIDLLAKPVEGEPADLSSRFIGSHELFEKAQHFEGTVVGEIEGTPYAGDFKETAEGHGHKH